jgi:hypothetical protein
VGVDTALLLVGFGVAKLAIAAGILWLGLRSSERPHDDGGYGGPGPEDEPPRPPARRASRRRPARRGPARSPARGAGGARGVRA